MVQSSKNPHFLLGFAAADGSEELYKCYYILNGNVPDIPKPGFMSVNYFIQDQILKSKPVQMLLSHTFTLLRRGSPSEEYTLIAENGHLQSYSTFSPNRAPIWAAARSLAPNGIDIWQSGGISTSFDEIEGQAINSCIFKKYIVLYFIMVSNA